MADTHAQLVELAAHISGLCHQLKIASDQPYEYSEAFTVGGPSGSYRLHSPYIGNVQYRVDSVSAKDATSSTILVSPDLNVTVPGFTATDTPTTEFSGIRGCLYLCPNNNTIPVDSSWYDLTDSNNVLFVQIVSTLSAYVTIQFRHKR